MRSGKLIAKNDYLIEEFIMDTRYRVSKNGVIEGKLGSKNAQKWKRIGSADREGYVRITYQTKRIFAHRIVYRLFNGPLKQDLVVEHKDGNPGNNAAENLLLITHKQNIEYKNRRLGRLGK